MYHKITGRCKKSAFEIDLLNATGQFMNEVPLRIGFEVVAFSKFISRIKTVQEEVVATLHEG